MPQASREAEALLRKAALEAELELDDLRTTYGAQHPKVVRVVQLLERINAELSKLRPEASPGTTPEIDPDLRSLDLKTLQSRYEAAERAAAQSADAYRSEVESPAENDSQHDNALRRYRDRTKAGVIQAYRLRRALQLAKITHTRSELTAVEQRIAQRDKLQERIIDRRIEDLLEGAELSWLVKEHSNETSPGGRPITGSAVGLPGPPHVPAGPSARAPGISGPGVGVLHGNSQISAISLTERENAMIGTWELVRLWKGLEIDESQNAERKFLSISRNPETNDLSVINIEGTIGLLRLDAKDVQKVTLQPEGAGKDSEARYEQVGNFMRMAIPMGRTPRLLEPAEGVSLAYFVRTDAPLDVPREQATDPMIAIVAVEIIFDEAAADMAISADAAAPKNVAAALSTPRDDQFAAADDFIEDWTRQIRVIGQDSDQKRESAIANLRMAIQSGSDTERLAALRVIASVGDVNYDKTQFRPLILEVIRNGSDEFLQPAFYALASTGRQPEDLKLLKEKLTASDDLLFVSWQTHLLGTFSDDKLDEDSEAMVLQQLNSADSSVRREALRGLWGLAVSDRIKARVIELVDVPESHHDAIYFGLSTLPNKDAAVVDKLIETLGDSDWNNRGRAVWGLGHGVNESERKRVAEAMLEFHNSRSDPRSRSRAANIVREYGDAAMRQRLNEEAESPASPK